MISETMLGGMVTLRPFVPARDYANSLAFYQRLGFTAWSLGERMAHMQMGRSNGAFCFLLQGDHAQDWTEHFAMHFLVDQLDPWWKHLTSLNLEEDFGVAAPIAPRMEPWGLRVAYFWDPAGVLWHLAEDVPPAESGPAA